MARSATAPTAIPAIAPLLSPPELGDALRIVVPVAAGAALVPVDVLVAVVLELVPETVPIDVSVATGKVKSGRPWMQQSEV